MLAVSYQRVSTGEQVGEARSGLDRQAAAFAAFCSRHGLTPAPAAVVDEGVSAFKGRHRREGGLAAFIAAAMAGHWPMGTILVVEDLDRFSREVASRQQALLLGLFDAGVALGVCRDDRIVDRDIYDTNLAVRLMLTIRADAAHDYSAKLSERIDASWRHRRERSLQGEKIAGFKPFWCGWDGADYVLNTHAATVQRMTQLCLDGLGLIRIAQALNAEGFRTAKGRTWAYANVHKVISDPRIVGDRPWSDGTVVPGYFPAVITRAEFDRCHKLITLRNSRKGQVGKGDAIRNLFQGHSYCTCGRLLSYQSRRSRSGETLYEYLTCVGKRHGHCDSQNVKYDEELILRALMRERWRHYFTASDRRHEDRKLRQKILAAEAEVAKHQAQAERYQAQLGSLLGEGRLSAKAANLIAAQVDQALAAASEAQEALQALQRRQAEMGAHLTGLELEEAIHGQVEKFIAESLQQPEVRQRFNAWLLASGVRITATDPVRNSWAMELDGRHHQAWALRYRGRPETVVEEGLSSVVAVALADSGKISQEAVPDWVREAADRKAQDFSARVERRLSSAEA
ncbi:recombinase family protein [Synechococcus sp. CBW1002]|uniref:recombinase family protein n=1 Tax=Synechococcus sp. CBW1002 TaxID=1353134 RepID=UPI001E471759|nr:recombinase family protein [Synechococcus sp. CBW1002]